MSDRPKIAIIQDALCVPGGSEKFTLWLSRVYPDAPIYTSVYFPEQTHPEFKQLDVRTLPGAKFIRSERFLKQTFPYWVYQFGRLDLSDYDVVISSAAYFSKYIKVTPPTRHISIIHAPFRLLWVPDSYTNDSLPVPKIFAPLARFIASRLRGWDIARTRSIDHVLANSKNVADEIKRVYSIDADVIYPPIEVDKYSIRPHKGEYFVTLSRLVSHKRIDLAIKACVELDRELWVIGDGPERQGLEAMSNDRVRFLGRLPEDELLEVLRSAKALLFPGQEDFGLAPLEAIACGVPVIAFGKGGALETVIDGVSGLFFPEQTAESLADAIKIFDATSFDQQAMRNSIMKFDIVHFKEEIDRIVRQEFEA